MIMKIIVGITGASGSIYGAEIVKNLMKKNIEVYLVITEYGEKVFEYELETDFKMWVKEMQKKGKLVLCDRRNMFSEIASGSFDTAGMVIAPCSMGTLAKIAHGTSDNLLIRAADVILKEKRNLVIVPRETPLSSIHLENMLKLSNLGVWIVPPSPAFYQKPKTLDEIVDATVGRVLKCLGVDNNLYKEWNGGIE
jgi:4-hydroxy-3-polyprenylbenzoate decarboxylase